MVIMMENIYFFKDVVSFRQVVYVLVVVFYLYIDIGQCQQDYGLR